MIVLSKFCKIEWAYVLLFKVLLIDKIKVVDYYWEIKFYFKHFFFNLNWKYYVNLNQIICKFCCYFPEKNKNRRGRKVCILYFCLPTSGGDIVFLLYVCLAITVDCTCYSSILDRNSSMHCMLQGCGIAMPDSSEEPAGQVDFPG